MKIFKKILLGLLVLLVLAGIGIYFWLQSTKPTLDGELQLKGLKAPVEVLYDDYGVPHIYAQNEDDLFHEIDIINDKIDEILLLLKNSENSKHRSNNKWSNFKYSWVKLTKEIIVKKIMNS
jgi:hypothetical protein